MYRHLLFIVFIFVFFEAKAQIADTTQHRNKKDSLNMKRDSLLSKPFVPKVKKPKVYHPDSTHSPRKAVMRSLYFPGWGQVYNRHGLWWRLPVLYTGLYFLVKNVYVNGRDYNLFLAESEWRSHGRQGTEPLPLYKQGTDYIVITTVSDQTIYNYKDNLRRNRDLSIFGIVGVWGVAAIDAYVEAKFIHSYSMDDNLSFKIAPSLMSTPSYASNFNTTFTPSLKITFFLR
ncbi:hypothetical protein BDD43_0288 [Mucilaginibacter gracilis]|uniref:DUF5683 domain-containing protein n=1 Tax=Mucilaginibacter gracilis TaxID=423350 RepID=A0A495IUE2_9SPHI|nr:DUF5683 domain-containing protein [Mucilaginibacter gracilis]RKR80192.1 hypothetical protein BDD43_0288 [Mucilaginibacter gracilis]